MNPIKPELMSAQERLDEICEILALGLIRLNARKSSELSADRGASSLDFLPLKRGHAGRTNRRSA